ncbi:MAG: ABC transporter permease [Bacteroidota bacterium]
MYLRLTLESFRFAWQALKSNVLRTVLSLLGVTVGIFAIIAVFTFVDSMEKNIKSSLSFFGNNVLYVQKWAWSTDDDYPWWKYFQRPPTNYQEMKFLEAKLDHAEAICGIDARGGVNVKNKSNSFEALVFGVTYQYNKISEVPVKVGRYFTVQEMEGGRNVAILGNEVTETLFPNEEDPVGKEFKLQGQKFVVIGVQEKKGKSMVDLGGDPDTKVIIPYLSYAKMFNGQKPEIDIAVKGFETDLNAEQLASEITGLMRSKRGLRPNQDDNFSLNRPEAIAKALDGIFAVLTLAGIVIGGFSILVGGFGIANIMFVSVKERTNIIGIQKSLGAKNQFILFQFLFESVWLCLLGGLIGLLLVYLLTFLPMGAFDLILTTENIILGFAISTFLGVVFGIIPAWMAAKLDPVTAIRSK